MAYQLQFEFPAETPRLPSQEAKLAAMNFVTAWVDSIHRHIEIETEQLANRIAEVMPELEFDPHSLGQHVLAAAALERRDLLAASKRVCGLVLDVASGEAIRPAARAAAAAAGVAVASTRKGPQIATDPRPSAERKRRRA